MQSEKARTYFSRFSQKKGDGLGKLLPKATPAALDLLGKMLTIDPRKRISVADALAHPFLAELHLPEGEAAARAASLRARSSRR